MKILTKLKYLMIGKPLNILNPKIKSHIALIAVIAWVGLGADGLSSIAYGPEEAFLALGHNTHIAIYLAFATAFTVFLISLSYNQVIELFPNGGGGYKVATHLLGSKAGVISGSALVVDYILTIAVSTAGGVDALFSLLPGKYAEFKVEFEVVTILILIILNLRGMKESIKILVPLFIGFLVTHVILIVAGVVYHYNGLPDIMPHAAKEMHSLTASIGIFPALALLLRAYSLGGGTYTGLEAVSNNVNMLAEPRVKTGRFTMLYMALSLSFTAGGIILLYLLWHVAPSDGKTLNAIVFAKIIDRLHLGHYWLPIVLFFEAALLFVAANTGFLGCPAVMANMAVDRWLPRQFRELSNRLVVQNGVLISGLASILVLLWAHGDLSILVSLYSVNVFLTFSLSLLGLSVYWIKSRHNKPHWRYKLFMSATGFVICSCILVITVLEKFTQGAWLTIIITTCMIMFCFFVKKHYLLVRKKLNDVDEVFANYIKDPESNGDKTQLNITDKTAKTAVFFVNKHYGTGLHAILWVKRLFPEVFTNFIFLTTGEIDSEAFSKDVIFKKQYRKDLHQTIEKYRTFCTENNLPSEGLFSYGVSEMQELIKLADYVQQDYPNCMFFASKLVFVDESWWSRMLHNNTISLLQRSLHLNGSQMVILPMKI